MSQFLIVYDQAAGAVLEIREFSDEDRTVALETRFAREHEHRHNDRIEVVVLGASSRDDLERTHGRYFKSVAQLADDV